MKLILILMSFAMPNLLRTTVAGAGGQYPRRIRAAMHPGWLVHGFIALFCASTGCATQHSPSPALASPEEVRDHPAPSATGTGILVMAHGGRPHWNARVDAALAGLRGRIPVELALGMANPPTLQAALDSLRHRGVETVAVVRLFISGASFLHQTEYLFGLRPDPPERAMAGHHMIDGNQLQPLEVRGEILLDRSGLAGSGEIARILEDKAGSRTSEPSRTAVLFIAHGMGSEKDNRALLKKMERGARSLRAKGYAEVRSATLREDWPEPRARAEREIRAAVTDMGRRWSRVVVVPYRLSGFGPYAEVLEGLEYVPAGSLLPHPLVTDWITARARGLFCAAGLESPLGVCPDSSGVSRAPSHSRVVGTR